MSHLVLSVCTCIWDIGTCLDKVIYQGGLSLGKTDSPSLSSHYLHAALHLWDEPCETSPAHVGMSTGIVIMQILIR